jgi:uncharacterized protein (DUF983 family)
MLACPRCGSEAQDLADDVDTLLRCEFCGEDLDAADLVLRAALDRLAQTTAEEPDRESELV